MLSRCVAAPRRLLLIGALVLPLVGCGEEKVAPVVDSTPQKTPAQIAEENAAIHVERVRGQFSRAQDRIDQDPTAFDNNIRNLEVLAFEAKGTALEEPVARKLAEQRQAREAYAQTRLDEIIVEVDRLVKEKDYYTPQDLLAQFDPEGLFSDTPAQKQCREKTDWVVTAQDGENDFLTISARARAFHKQGGIEDLANAIGHLESYSDVYAETPYYPEVRETIALYLGEFLALKAKRAASENVPWKELKVDQYLSEFGARSSGDADVWTASDDVITGNNVTEQLAMLEIGEDNWTSFIVELELKVPSGQTLNVGVTYMSRLGSQEKQYDVENFVPESKGWLRLLVDFRDGRVQMKDLETLDPLVLPYTPRTAGEGGIALFLKPGEKIEVRNVRTKVLSKREPAGDGGGDEPGD